MTKEDQETEFRMVAALKEGDLVDLHDDPYAEGLSESFKGSWAWEFAKVWEIERVTPDCIAVDFEGLDVIGFPPRHFVKVKVTE